VKLKVSIKTIYKKI